MILTTVSGSLIFLIEDHKFEWPQQYILGLEVKNLVGAPLDAKLFLSIKDPWKDEPIGNNDRVNLARPGIERFHFKDVFYFTLNGEKYRSFQKIVTGTEILHIGGISNVRCYALYQKLQGCNFEKIRLDEKVDLNDPGIERFITKDADTFTYTVDGEPEMTDKKSLSSNEILRLAGKNPETHYLIQRIAEQQDVAYAWNPDEPIAMDCKGLTFETERWLDIVDIEDYGKHCKPVPPARKYRVKIDKQYHVVNQRYISCEEIIALEGKPQVKYSVYKHLSGTPKPIRVEPGTSVDLTEHCLLKFVLQPKEQQEGRGNRQQFTLPEEDVETLEQLRLSQK